MKKLTRKTLDDLAKEMSVINKSGQRSFIGRGDGTQNNPYTESEFNNMVSSGIWDGGYVEGWGYTYPNLSCIGSFSGGADVAESELRSLLVPDGFSIVSSIMQEFLPPGAGAIVSGQDGARGNQINDILNYMHQHGLDSVYKIDTVTRDFQGGGTYDYRTTIESRYFDRQTGEYIGSVYFYY